MSKDFIYLALGTNLGDRRNNLETAVRKLEENGVKFLESSPVYRTPALLLKGSPDDWNRPFLNCIIKVDTELPPKNLLRICKKVEMEMGRDLSQKWAPRVIDIDILFYKDFTVDISLPSPSKKHDVFEPKLDNDFGNEYSIKDLIIPHVATFNRYFLRDELSFLYPESLVGKNYYGGEHQPIFMGILNVTPDSFSDGGIHNNAEKFKDTFELWEKEFVGIVDIGAESTRPGAEPLTSEEELERLNPIFEYLKNREFSYFKPKLSIDTYHYDTAKKAIENGFDIINDVNALRDERMIDLIKDNRNLSYVLMHSLSVPPRKDLIINDIGDVKIWLENKIELLEKKNIDKNQIIFDLGFGFGKNPSQALKLMQNVKDFQKYGIKILVGHSRKGFMKIFNNDVKTPDAETLAISLGLSNEVDILRVHTPIEHQNALLAYRSINNQFV